MHFYPMRETLFRQPRPTDKQRPFWDQALLGGTRRPVRIYTRDGNCGNESGEGQRERKGAPAQWDQDGLASFSWAPCLRVSILGSPTLD